MEASFRGLLDDLRAAGQLVEITKPVDIRYIATLVDQSDTALLFTNVIGYDMPVVSGLTNSRERLAIAMGCAFSEIEGKLRRGIDHPIEPVMINSGPVREVVQSGDDVDLFKLPVPLFSVLDGGPMITAGITLAHDEEHGHNCGVYRYLVKEKALTGIDLVNPNNLRKFADKAFAAGEPLPISINIGTHPYELITATYKAQIGTNEMAISGGMRGEAMKLTPCQTIDLPCIADAEIVLEAEILPTGWVKPEGRFGEFTRLMGGLHWNPHVRIKAVSMRKDAIYYALHMPWENIWPSSTLYEAGLRRSLKEAGIQVTAVNVTPGGSCHWHAVIAIKPMPGDGKNTLIAALSVADFKHIVVVDEDIDVFNGTDVEWAIATRVQADKDVVIISGARSKPLDPSIPPTPGKIPLTAKMGIDATIGNDVPRHRFHRITYGFTDTAKLADFTGKANGGVNGGAKAAPSGVDIAALAVKIKALIADEPLYFRELAERFEAEGFQAVSRAVGELHQSGDLWQDEEGRLCLKDSPFAASPPPSQ